MQRAFGILLVVALSGGGLGSALAANAEGVTHFPREISRSCRGGIAQMYDECGSQTAIFENAMQAARDEDKVVIVIYGAEWCIWCHVLEKHLNGEEDRFYYSLEGDAFALNEGGERSAVTPDALNSYAQQRLVLAHIENQYSADGHQVLIDTGADAFFDGALPYVFSVNDGAVAGVMTSPQDLQGLERRREGFDWYRGYNRALLLKEMMRLFADARNGNT